MLARASLGVRSRMEPPLPIGTQVDDLSSREAQVLVAEHLADMHGNSPPGHVNALALEGLRKPGITFWTAWLGENLCGCGALKELSGSAGEVKSMRTRSAYARQGIGQAVLSEIICTAQARGYRHLYLETGTGSAFEAAHAFYAKNGFVWCGAFGDYEATEFNVFMAKAL